MNGGRKSFGAKKGARGAAGSQSKDGQRRPMFRRRKVCKFCVDKTEWVDYKDTKLLQGFILERAKILPRRISGTCARHQRMVQEAIKRSRHLALIPFTAD